jgi:HK97 family phage major capsid protein
MRGTAQYLEKATLTTADLASGGLLTPEQTQEFLRIAIESTPLLQQVRVVTSNRPKFQIPRVSMDARVMRGGTQATRLLDADRVKPALGQVELSTVLLKAEIPLSDESLEDNIEEEGFLDTIAEMAGEAVGRDVEELIVKGDTARTGGEDAYLDLLDGVVKQAQAGLPSAQKYNASGATSYEAMLAEMVKRLPPKYRRDPSRLRFFLPIAHRDGYQDALSMRGTTLGDQAVSTDIRADLAFRGSRVVGVPNLYGTDNINSSAFDYGKAGLFVDPTNIVLGFQRRIRFETFRDPREGAPSLIVTTRLDVKIADPNAAVYVHSIPF